MNIFSETNNKTTVLRNTRYISLSCTTPCQGWIFPPCKLLFFLEHWNFGEISCLTPPAIYTGQRGIDFITGAASINNANKQSVIPGHQKSHKYTTSSRSWICKVNDKNWCQFHISQKSQQWNNNTVIIGKMINKLSEIIDDDTCSSVRYEIKLVQQSRCCAEYAITGDRLHTASSILLVDKLWWGLLRSFISKCTT